MKRIALAVLAASTLALSGCAAMGAAATVASVVTSGPVVVCDRTQADETLARSAEIGYKAARLLVETGVQAGLIHGTNAAKVQDLNRTAYNALLGVRAAYRSCNAASINKALTEANRAIAALTALAPGGQ